MVPLTVYKSVPKPPPLSERELSHLLLRLLSSSFGSPFFVQPWARVLASTLISARKPEVISLAYVLIL